MPIVSNSQTDVAMTTTDRDELRRCEGVISTRLKAFLEVGRSLMTIRDKRLYRETHATFSEYCKSRWELSRSRAYQFIDSVVIHDEITEQCDGLEPPARESHVRVLVGCPREQRAAIWSDVVAANDGDPKRVTVKDLRKACGAEAVPRVFERDWNDVGNVAIELLHVVVTEPTPESMRVTRRHAIEVLTSFGLLTKESDEALINHLTPDEKRLFRSCLSQEDGKRG